MDWLRSLPAKRRIPVRLTWARSIKLNLSIPLTLRARICMPCFWQIMREAQSKTERAQATVRPPPLSPTDPYNPPEATVYYFSSREPKSTPHGRAQVRIIVLTDRNTKETTALVDFDDADDALVKEWAE